jgi:hypothetical protein
VELVFDPFDLTVLSVRCGGRDAGTATPHHITRHSHPKARLFRDVNRERVGAARRRWG